MANFASDNGLGSYNKGDYGKDTAKKTTTKTKQETAKKDTTTKTTTAAKTTTQASKDTTAKIADSVAKTIAQTFSQPTLDTIIKDTSTGIHNLQDQYTGAALVNATVPTMRTAADLAAQYGITYDRQAIEDILTSAAKAEYDTKNTGQKQAERTYNAGLAGTQNTLLDTLKQQQTQAVMNGANKGMQAANALSAILGVSQESVQGATELAQARALLANEYAANLAGARKDALTQANAAGGDLLAKAATIYGYDTTKYGEQMQYNANVNTANANYGAQKYASNASMVNQNTANRTALTNSYYDRLAAIEQAKQNGVNYGMNYGLATK